MISQPSKTSHGSLEPGALPQDDTIPLCVPHFAGEEWQYVKECLDSGWVSSAGPFVNRIEKEMADYVGRSFGVATVSGTSAIHLALQVAGVKTNEEVLVSDLTFIAPVNAIKYLGAVPVLVDAEPKYWQMDVELLRRFLKNECERRDNGVFNKDTGRRIAALLPVHILGHSVDMEPVVELGSIYNVPVVEDATEALGAEYRGRKVGAHGLLSCYSFNGNKIITAGGGGMIVTDDCELADRCRYLSTQAKDDALFYVHNEVGYNYRLTNLQAALAVAQLEQLEHFVAVKRSIAERYNSFLLDVEAVAPLVGADWGRATYWMYTIRIEEENAKETRDNLLEKLNEQKIQARPLWQPMHESPAHQDCQAILHESAVSTQLASSTISLPCSVCLSDNEFERVCSTLISSLRPPA